MTRGKTQIAIVAGEPSGDNLGSGLINALKASLPDARFVGVGGPKMRAAGCDTLYDMDRIELMGIEGLFGRLGDILRIRNVLYRKFRADKPDLFIGIDVPDFNLNLELRLRKHGVKTVHYVSPTVWAWRGYRIHRIRKAVTHMLTLFPFEAEYYRRRRVPVTCVGHPMADEIDAPDTASARRKLGLGESGPVIGLLPGSRGSEVRRLGPVLIEAARLLHAADPATRFVLPFANERVEAVFRQVVGRTTGLPITTFQGQSRLVIEASDVVALASGTAALESALLRKPHVVVYKLGAFTYRLFKKLRHVDHYSMPNQLLSEPLVPELIQQRATGENVAAAVRAFIDDPGRTQKLREQFSDLHRQLRLDANRRASRAVLDLLNGGD